MPHAAPVISADLFAVRLHDQLRSGAGNLCFSPFSLFLALAMTEAGARGETAREMRAVLAAAPPDAAFHAALGDLVRKLNEPREHAISLLLANALWAQEGRPLLPEFLALMKSGYRSLVRQADFTRQAEKARHEINSWVGVTTQGRIRELVRAADLNALTRLVIVNAVYFKGAWERRFAPKETSHESFHLAGGRTVPVPFMRREAETPYAEGEDWQAVELTGLGGEFGMTVILPVEGVELETLEARLGQGLLEDCAKRLAPQVVKVLLPRFKMSHSTGNLRPELERLGMASAFGAAADFSGMTGDRTLALAAVVHQAAVEVNEEGAEATAATAVTMMFLGTFKPAKPRIFRADRPFLFAIREKRTGALLFFGRVADPR